MLQHYTRLHNRRFSRHPTFVLIAFDVCGRKRVATSTTVRARCRPGEFESIGKVTRDEVATALQRKRRRRIEALSGRTIGTVSDRKGNTSKADVLLRNVTVSQGRMWGSNEEKVAYRRKAFSMDCFFKTGALLVTITPSDIGTLTVALIAGQVNIQTLGML